MKVARLREADTTGKEGTIEAPDPLLEVGRGRSALDIEDTTHPDPIDGTTGLLPGTDHAADLVLAEEPITEAIAQEAEADRGPEEEGIMDLCAGHIQLLSEAGGVDREQDQDLEATAPSDSLKRIDGSCWRLLKQMLQRPSGKTWTCLRV